VAWFAGIPERGQIFLLESSRVCHVSRYAKASRQAYFFFLIMVCQFSHSRIFAHTLASALALTLAACATLPGPDPVAEGLTHEPPLTSPWAKDSGVSIAADNGTVKGATVLPPVASSHWAHYRLPGKQPTDFRFAALEGRNAMAARADASASMLRRQVRVEAPDLGSARFSWKVPDLIASADMAHRDFDDSPVRIVLAFEGDRAGFSANNAMLNELTRALTGEEMPYAVMMYVWSKQRPVGAVIPSPRTDRIRKLVVESGAQRLHHWVDYERDVARDFEQVFGEPPGALVGIGIMTDTDNTRTKAMAWYGPLQLVQRSRVTARP
jgi:Protein of unknown function (DUF3047)